MDESIYQLPKDLKDDPDIGTFWNLLILAYFPKYETPMHTVKFHAGNKAISITFCNN